MRNLDHHATCMEHPPGHPSKNCLLQFFDKNVILQKMDNEHNPQEASSETKSPLNGAQGGVLTPGWSTECCWLSKEDCQRATMIYPDEDEIEAAFESPMK